MKKFIIVACCFCFLFSCSRKTVPPKPNYSLDNSNNNTETIIDSVTSNPIFKDSSATVTANAVLIIADGYGRLITPEQNLPQDAGVKYNNLQLSKGFTAQQKANLQARYKTIPPRVLYVPAELSSNSLKGSYYILKKKFWYWKKSDGLFYLDQKYYL